MLPLSSSNQSCCIPGIGHRRSLSHRLHYRRITATRYSTNRDHFIDHVHRSEKLTARVSYVNYRGTPFYMEALLAPGESGQQEFILNKELLLYLEPQNPINFG